MRMSRGVLALVCLLGSPLWAADAQMEPKPYDLLFRNGTLGDIPADRALVYDRDVQNSLTPAAATRDTGLVVLGIEEGERPQAELQFRQDSKHRNLGSFPASVGNPIIMYFVETVVRDMAESVGGSPFYIRNRVKESLLRPAERAESAEGVSLTLRPFDGDPNAARMQGFDRLALTVTMSDEVPGWYRSLRADVPGADGGAPIYSSVMTFETLEAE